MTKGTHRQRVETWRREYNEEGPQGIRLWMPLGYRTPAEVAQESVVCTSPGEGAGLTS